MDFGSWKMKRMKEEEERWKREREVEMEQRPLWGRTNGFVAFTV